MPRKKGNSPYYKVQRKNLPGYGDTGLLSTRTKSLRRAQEMEDLLEWLADEEMYDLLDALKPQVRGGSGRLTIPKLLRAKKENRDRKSTRLNSSHVKNSYAVYCLKK